MNHKLLLVISAALACARIGQATTSDAASALEQLKSLAGDWEGNYEWTGARTASGSMTAGYYVTGNGSAVVENLVMENVPVMTSVYHLDGADLRMTHFCGAQNQPRLKADRIDLPHGIIDFSFVDITNLKSPDAGHVHGLELRLTDSNRITVTFIFQSGAKESRERIALRRTQKKISQKTDAAGAAVRCPMSELEKTTSS